MIWPAAAAAKETGHLLAGAAAVDVSLPPGVPLGGYGGFPRRAWLPDVFGRHPYAFWFRPSTGVHDPFRVRSLALESGRVRLLWLTVDLVGIDPTLLAELRARLARQGLGDVAVIAAASHTHSGPGAYGDSALFGFIAIDRRSSAVRDRILDGLERAAREALARTGPASVAWGRTDVTDITDSRVQERLDPELGVLKVTRPDGQPVAIVWNYAIHGTALGRDNLLLSGDLMGEASARLERELGVPALFVNGAVGDVSPRPRGWPGVKVAGGALAEGAARAWAQAGEGSRELEVVQARVTLPSPAVALRNCLGGWTPGGMTLGLSAALPSSSEIVAASVGGTGWVTIPGELDTRLGAAVKAAGRGRFDHVFVAGVSNDYLGYFLTPEHYRRPSYIACSSLYGERGGEIVRDAAVAALNRLAPSTGNRPPRSRSSLREQARPRRGRPGAARGMADRLRRSSELGRGPTAGRGSACGAALRRAC
jgi:Neutral/alkaline non-lysosomal ceramidase, N-terminal